MNVISTAQKDSVTGESVEQTSSNGAADVNVAGGAVAIDNTIPGVTNEVTLAVNPINGSAPFNAVTTAYTASLQVKASASMLYGLSGYSSKGSAQFIQIHDSAALPAEGAVPKVVFTVGASSNFSIDFGVFAMAFYNGVYVVNSSTGPTKTIGSADCWIAARFV